MIYGQINVGIPHSSILWILFTDSFMGYDIVPVISGMTAVSALELRNGSFAGKVFVTRDRVLA